MNKDNPNFLEEMEREDSMDSDKNKNSDLFFALFMLIVIFGSICFTIGALIWGIIQLL